MRVALVLNQDGLYQANSVLAAYTGGTISDGVIDGGKIISHGDLPVKDPDHDPTALDCHDIKLFSFDLPDYCTDCRATFRDMDIFGNFYNSITNAQKPMMMKGMPGGKGGPGGPGGPGRGPGHHDRQRSAGHPRARPQLHRRYSCHGPVIFM